MKVNLIYSTVTETKKIIKQEETKNKKPTQLRRKGNSQESVESVSRRRV